jgi:hypothetical protein
MEIALRLGGACIALFAAHHEQTKMDFGWLVFSDLVIA